MKILLTGGGTAGSVSPLLAIYSRLRAPACRQAGIDSGLKKSDVLWLGTRNGPEVKMVKEYGIEFKPILAGKMRRYFDFRNFFDFFKIILAFWQSFFIILKFKPDVILSAGSFVSVPVVWAGWFLGRKCYVHQQDIRPGLANKLMAPFARKITVTFEESLKYFPAKKTVWTGNPVREEILQGSKERAFKRFGLEKGIPVVLVMGGGIGSVVINDVLLESLDQLTQFCQIIHLSGAKIEDRKWKMDCYKHDEFLDVLGMADAYAVADLVVSRGGLSSLTELSALSKPTIFIPLKDTHQEDNVKYILKKKAGEVVWQKGLSVDTLVKVCKDILSDDRKRDALSRGISKIMPQGGAEKIVEFIS